MFCWRRLESWALDLGVFLGSQLTEISGRFPEHVQEIRELLLKEKLPVPSPEAIPELSSRLKTDERFRADVASLMRATLYQEREGIGYEDLLGILVVAAAGTERDLNSESQEADIREMLRFLLQSRRVTFRPEADGDEPKLALEAEPRQSVPVRVQLTSEPVRARGMQSVAHSKKLELRDAEPPVTVAEPERRDSSDVVLPTFGSTGIFASQMEPEGSRWKDHTVWIVGVVCMLLGLGLGLKFHQVVSAAETHLPALARRNSSIQPKTAASVAAKGSPVAAANMPGSQKAEPVLPTLDRGRTAAAEPERPAAAVVAGAAMPSSTPFEGRSTPPPAIAEAGAGVPVTVVKQVVTASPVADAENEPDATQLTAKTRSIVHQGSAGMTAANVVYSPAPEYPAAAAAARVHGEVTVHAVVDPDGKVIYARAVSGPALLRDAAQEAVQKWRYSPLLDNGKPIAVTTTAVLDFRFAR